MNMAMKVGALVLPSLLAPVLAAQQTSGSNDQRTEPSLPTLKTETRNVIVDVVATDKNGKPVMTLDRSQFQVYEFPMMVRAAQTQAQKPVAAAGGHS